MAWVALSNSCLISFSLRTILLSAGCSSYKEGGKGKRHRRGYDSRGRNLGGGVGEGEKASAPGVHPFAGRFLASFLNYHGTGIYIVTYSCTLCLWCTRECFNLRSCFGVAYSVVSWLSCAGVFLSSGCSRLSLNFQCRRCCFLFLPYPGTR